MPRLDRIDDVFVLDLGDGENRFTPAWLTELDELLDRVEGAEGPRALLTTATGKFFSNGLDLEWVAAHPEQRRGYVEGVQRLFARVLTLPLVTVAAVQGHAFAAGAMLTLAHDLRLMRADRGFWCLPEADIGLPFAAGMSALIRARLAPQVAHEAMVTARRYGGTAAATAGIVDGALGEDELRDTALRAAREQAGRAGPVLAAIKREMYSPVLAALAAPLP